MCYKPSSYCKIVWKGSEQFIERECKKTISSKKRSNVSKASISNYLLWKIPSKRIMCNNNFFFFENLGLLIVSNNLNLCNLWKVITSNVWFFYLNPRIKLFLQGNFHKRYHQARWRKLINFMFYQYKHNVILQS